MTLRWCEGFDTSTTGLQRFETFSAGTIGATGGRFGTNGLNLTNLTNSVMKQLNASYGPTLFIGLAFGITSQPAATSPIFVLQDAGTAQLSLCINDAGVIDVRRGTQSGTSLASSGSNVLQQDGRFYYIEAKFFIHDSTGTVEVKVNGDVWISGSGLDTKATANNTVNQIRLGQGSGSSTGINYRYDDIYFCDDAGSTNNTYLGDIAVRGLIPNAAGTTTQWTPLSSTNISNVDDTTAADDDTTYNSSSTVGQKDTFNMTNLSVTTGTILGVQTMRRSRKDDAGTRQLKTKIRHSSSEADGATSSNESASYVSYLDIFEQNPSTTAAWTPTEVNAMEVGYEVVA